MKSSIDMISNFRQKGERRDNRATVIIMRARRKVMKAWIWFRITKLTIARASVGEQKITRWRLTPRDSSSRPY